MLISFAEIIDIIITAIAASFIFSDLLVQVQVFETFGERLVTSGAVVVPAIVLHEFGHKFAAIALGHEATFHAAYTWLAIGIVLKLLSFPFLFVVPAYVTSSGGAGLDQAWIAFAGPAVNALLWAGCAIALKVRTYSNTTTAVLHFSRNINGILFIINMLPIPFFDGSAFWGTLWHTFVQA